MTTGVRVIWHDDDGKIIEIEYFYGIDVADLDKIPEFSRVQAVWPESVDLTWGEWVVDAHCDRTQPGEVPSSSPTTRRNSPATTSSTLGRTPSFSSKESRMGVASGYARAPKICTRSSGKRSGQLAHGHARPIADQGGRLSSGR